MGTKKTSRKRTRKQKLLKTFFKAVLITCIICLMVVGGGVWAYQTFIYDDGGVGGSASTGKDNTNKTEEEKVNKTVAVFGTDIEGYRTDVIFVANYNSETNKGKVVSIPRDTRVEWTTEQKDRLREIKGYTREVSKINEMTAYAGIENVRDFTISQIEALLGIKIDNYVVVSLDAFKQIVDAVGGVEVDVPMDMHYEDPYQDLYIHLDKGLQVLDGKKAEMLVRFRKGYVDGDEGRIRTQQLFLEAFAKKVMSPQIVTRIPQLITVLFNTVTTDVQLNDILPYYGYAKKFDLQNLEFHTIPGESQYINGAWYYMPNMEEMQSFSNEIFFEHLMPTQEDLETGKVVIDQGVTIEILNASGLNGIASKAKTTLEAEGYTVGSIGNYAGEYLEATEILAKDINRAQQFRAYYPLATIKKDTTLTTDIQILLGKK